jgi:hypothetical protein
MSEEEVDDRRRQEHPDEGDRRRGPDRHDRRAPRQRELPNAAGRSRDTREDHVGHRHTEHVTQRRQGGGDRIEAEIAGTEEERDHHEVQALVQLRGERSGVRGQPVAEQAAHQGRLHRERTGIRAPDDRDAGDQRRDLRDEVGDDGGLEREHPGPDEGREQDRRSRVEENADRVEGAVSLQAVDHAPEAERDHTEDDEGQVGVGDRERVRRVLVQRGRQDRGADGREHEPLREGERRRRTDDRAEGLAAPGGEEGRGLEHSYGRDDADHVRPEQDCGELAAGGRRERAGEDHAAPEVEKLDGDRGGE